MADVLVKFDTTITTHEGRAYRPQACGRVSDDGLWEGWVEFLPVRGADEAIRTGRETEQPNQTDLRYWAEGLTQVYLEGALNRALSEPGPVRAPSSATPAFDAPRRA